MKPPPPVTRTFVSPLDTAAWNPTRMPADELSPALRAAALSLRVDAVTAEVVSKLRESGVRTILLKGPSIAEWLYADGTFRSYGDTDLLVASETLQATSGALRAAGFREQPGVSSYTWFRRSDRSIVDLHDTLFGVESPREEAWRALSEGTETMRVGGLEVEVLNRSARLLYIALHAAQHESHTFQQPLKDLERALRHADEQQWGEAAALATSLQAGPTFAAGLRLHPDGARLADRIKLPGERPLMLSLREGGGRPFVATLERLTAASPDAHVAPADPPRGRARRRRRHLPGFPRLARDQPRSQALRQRRARRHPHRTAARSRPDVPQPDGGHRQRPALHPGGQPRRDRCSDRRLAQAAVGARRPPADRRAWVERSRVQVSI